MLHCGRCICGWWVVEKDGLHNTGQGYHTQKGKVGGSDHTRYCPNVERQPPRRGKHSQQNDTSLMKFEWRPSQYASK